MKEIAVAAAKQTAAGIGLATDGLPREGGGRTMLQEQQELKGPGVVATVGDRSLIETFDIRPVPEATQARRRHSTAHFLRHLGEMIVAMMLGMAVLGMVSQVSLTAIGLDYDGSPLEWPAVSALVMALNMSVPMVWWMRHRGHNWSYATEMAAAMFVPVLALIPLLGLGIISGDTLSGIQHAVMIPSMLVVMFRRRGELAQ
jgi:flagellar biosynthetic protein FliP